MRPAPCIRGRADGEQCDGRESPCRREPESCQAQSTCTPPKALVATASAPAEGLDKRGAGGEDISAQLILTTIAGARTVAPRCSSPTCLGCPWSSRSARPAIANAVVSIDRGTWDQRVLQG